MFIEFQDAIIPRCVYCILASADVSTSKCPPCCLHTKLNVFSLDILRCRDIFAELRQHVLHSSCWTQSLPKYLHFFRFNICLNDERIWLWQSVRRVRMASRNLWIENGLSFLIHVNDVHSCEQRSDWSSGRWREWRDEICQVWQVSEKGKNNNAVRDCFCASEWRILRLGLKWVWPKLIATLRDSKACFIRRIFAASNAIETIDCAMIMRVMFEFHSTWRKFDV